MGKYSSNNYIHYIMYYTATCIYVDYLPSGLSISVESRHLGVYTSTSYAYKPITYVTTGWLSDSDVQGQVYN
ncbi:hypothetical protein FHK02_801 [Spirosoma sp. LMG 31448]|uniref:Uncharacterized protein n=1 Tax=Spirosoma utsteinense TaxID=2585773 RepID=A0ABR6W3L0_9BACT|nr:hypothetical protein [Spirosoma utsteinense]MBC3790819.1 hypothetical protein [Spirosoma utsteinense]